MHDEHMTTRNLKTAMFSPTPPSAAAGCTGRVAVEIDVYTDDCCGPSVDRMLQCPDSACSFTIGHWDGDLDVDVLIEAQALHDAIVQSPGSPAPTTG